MDFWSPLYLLIESRRKDLGLSKAALARMCGCKNVNKGIAWIDAITQGLTNHARAREIMSRLPAALDLPQAEFERALAETHSQVALRKSKETARREELLRASFRPHAYLMTEFAVPTQIVICGLVGGPDNILRIDLDVSQGPITFVRQALTVAKQRPIVPFFGRTRGIVINYNFDSATVFDLDGNPTEVLERAYSPGAIELSGRMSIPALRFTLGV